MSGASSVTEQCEEQVVVDDPLDSKFEQQWSAAQKAGSIFDRIGKGASEAADETDLCYDAVPLRLDLAAAAALSGSFAVSPQLSQPVSEQTRTGIKSVTAQMERQSVLLSEQLGHEGHVGSAHEGHAGRLPLLPLEDSQLNIVPKQGTHHSKVVLATPSPLLCVPRGVPSAVIGSAWGLFDTLDTNGDGVVDRMEFEAGITALRPLEMTSLPPLPSELSLKSLNGHVESSTGL